MLPPVYTTRAITNSYHFYQSALSEPKDARNKKLEGKCLTMPRSRKKRHPVDRNGDGTMFIVEVVDMVGGAQTRRNSRRTGLDWEQSNQGEPEYLPRTITQTHAETELGPGAPVSEHGGGCKKSTHVC